MRQYGFRIWSPESCRPTTNNDLVAFEGISDEPSTVCTASKISFYSLGMQVDRKTGDARFEYFLLQQKRKFKAPYFLSLKAKVNHLKY
jgi:hypothetical protein